MKQAIFLIGLSIILGVTIVCVRFNSTSALPETRKVEWVHDPTQLRTISEKACSPEDISQVTKCSAPPVRSCAGEFAGVDRRIPPAGGVKFARIKP